MRMNEPLTLGRWMKRLRADLDLTQEALAEAVGCAVQTIRTFENGTRRPSRELVERLAAVLHVPSEQRADFLRLARSPVGERATMSVERSNGNGAAAPSSTPRGSAQAAIEPLAAPQVAPILATKLYMPRPGAEVVPRAQLVTRLDAGLGGALTLIAAPAGFGKTMLLAEWLSRPMESRYVAWLALDASDSTPHQFLRYLIAALQTIAPGIGAPTLALIQASQAPPVETLLPFLLNDLAQLPDRSILVLDDYHAIDNPTVHQALAFLLDHLPAQLHLVIATRVDPPLPLSRLRVRRQLTELRAHDLRFTPEEAARFLREVMGLPLSGEDVAALGARTEGWIAGLQLAALSLRDRRTGQQAEFIAAFTGSHRFVMDYLVDEVLAHQPPHLQTFLLQTSILDRLSGPLCDAVVLGDGDEPAARQTAGGSQHAYSQLLIEELERNNLFIIPLDDARHWYRYHHLFSQLLRERLATGASGDAMASLHRRASRWFEHNGLLPEAMQHVLAAQDWGHAAWLLEQNAEAMLMRGEFLTLHRWVQAVPRNVVAQQPHLVLAHAWAQLLAEPSRPDTVEAMLRDVEVMLGSGAESATPDREPAALRGKMVVIRASIASSRDDIPLAITLADEALTTLPPDNLFWRTIPAVDRGLALDAAGQLTEASQALAEAIDLCHLSGHSYGAIVATMHLARVRAAQGQLHAAAALHQRGFHMTSEQGWEQLPMLRLLHVLQSKLLYEWNDLPSATRHLLEALERADPRRQLWVLLEGYAALARVKQAQGDEQGALDMMQCAEEVALASAAPWAGPLVRTYQARLWLAQDKVDRAARWAEAAGLRLDGELVFQHELEYVTLARLQIARGLPAEALPLLQHLMSAAEAAGRHAIVIEIVVLQALAMKAIGDVASAIRALHRALVLAGPEGYVRTFVDEGRPMAALLAQAVAVNDWSAAPDTRGQDLRAYTDRLLAVFRAEGIDVQASPSQPVSTPHSLAPTNETLTTRELEVLRLLATGHSNQAIAEELIVAIGTVKRHVNSILSKLDTHSRLQAVARARELDLI